MAFTFLWALSCLPERVYSFPVSWRHVESLLRLSPCHFQSLPVELIHHPSHLGPQPQASQAAGFLCSFSTGLAAVSMDFSLSIPNQVCSYLLAVKLVFNFCPALVNQLHLPSWVVGWKLSWPRRLQTPIVLTQSSSKFARNKHLSICYLHFVDLQSLEMV